MSHIEAFIEHQRKATTPIQSVSTVVKRLEDNGFKELKMAESWRISEGSAYYVRPFPSTVIAFKSAVSNYQQKGFRIIISHTDTPGFKVKPNPEVVSHGYLKLNTEVYPAPILRTWLDRPLSLAGMVVLRSENPYEPKTIELDIQRPLLTIPSIAIHFDKEVNKGSALNPQINMMPLIGQLKDTVEKEGYLLSLLAKEVGCEEEEILDYDLYVYVQEETCLMGADMDMISGPRIDNQASVFSSIQALIDSEPLDGIAVAACFDNEEVGSMTNRGVDSTLLYQVTERIGLALSRQREQIYRMWNRSFVISSDGAHAAHPNRPEKNDLTNLPLINGGMTIKVSAKQSYGTNGVTSGVFKQLCEKADVPYQYLVNRSDLPGGKSMGPIAARYLTVPAIDVGMPMLAMHSARELAGVRDLDDAVKVFTTFFND